MTLFLKFLTPLDVLGHSLHLGNNPPLPPPPPHPHFPGEVRSKIFIFMQSLSMVYLDEFLETSHDIVGKTFFFFFLINSHITYFPAMYI